jgi:hypothetical protein
MELIELHVGEGRASLGSERNAVAGSHGGISCIGINLARTAGSDQNGARRDALEVIIAIEQIGTEDTAVRGDKVGDGRPFSKADALVDGGEVGEGAADFGSGGVAVSVKNAGQ